MSFLFPAMLGGLAALSLPIILHLIARQRFPVMDFPSIRLLQGENRTNTLAPKLVDVWQLLLRLLVLALLVLAMARLFAPGLSSQPAPRNTIVVIDGSASMMQLVDDPDAKEKPAKKVTLFELARRRAEKILGDVSAPSRASLIVAGGTTSILAPLEPGNAHALKGLEQAKPYDACGSGLVEAVASACDMLRGRREVGSQIVVLTNLRRSAFDYRSQRDLAHIAEARKTLGDSLDMVVVDLAPPEAEKNQNLGITNAYLRGRQVMAGADAHFISTIVNTGTQPLKTKVSLSIGDEDAAQKSKAPTPGGKADANSRVYEIAPGARAIVDQTTPVNRAMRTFAKVSIDGNGTADSFPLDDQFSVPLPVIDTRRVLIVNGHSQSGGGPSDAGSAAMRGLNPSEEKKSAHEPEIDGATILKFVLNPGRELGGASNSGIDPVVVTPEALAVQPLSKYEIVILYDVNNLPGPPGRPDQVIDDLATFVSEGRSLLIICSANTNARQFDKNLAAGTKERPALAPAELEENEIDSVTSKSPLEISLKDNTHPIVSAFADPRHGDLSVIRFDRIRDLRHLPGDANEHLPEGTTSILQTPGEHPHSLAVERMMGRGRVVMFTFGFELNRGNIARTRVFPPFMWRVVDYLTGRLKTLPPDQLVARTPAALDVSETNFSLTSNLELVRAEKASQGGKPLPGSEPIALSASPDRTVMVDGLAPGRYLLEKARDRNEKGLVINYTRGVTVQSDPRAGDMARIDSAEVARLIGAAPTHPPKRGGEFWKIFVIALIVAYAVEAIAGFLATARREKERAPDGGTA